MRRHDFYAGGIEGILNVFVEVRHYVAVAIGIFDVCIDLIARIVLLQFGFENKGLGMLEHSGCTAGGVDKQLMYEAPRGIVANCHGGMDYQDELPCRGAVVHRMR